MKRFISLSLLGVAVLVMISALPSRKQIQHIKTQPPNRTTLIDLATPTVLAATECTTTDWITCKEASDVYYGTCRAQKGSIRHCREAAREFYSNCLDEKGCFVPAQPPGCQCGWDYRLGLCRICDDESTCDLFDDFGPEISPCLYGSESPVLIDTRGNGFQLTSAVNGVTFDIRNDGTPVQIAWTETDSDDAWLVLDRNGNGRIDNGAEMFGDHTEQSTIFNKNGFAALKDFDSDLDGRITSADPIYLALRLWQDKNHNGISEPEELSTVADRGIFSIGCIPKESRHKDRYGNEFRFRAKVNDTRFAYDVFLTLH